MDRHIPKQDAPAIHWMKRRTCASGNRESDRPLARLKCSPASVIHTMHLLTRRYRKFPPLGNRIRRDGRCTMFFFSTLINYPQRSANELRDTRVDFICPDKRAKTFVDCLEHLIRFKFDDSVLELAVNWTPVNSDWFSFSFDSAFKRPVALFSASPFCSSRNYYPIKGNLKTIILYGWKCILESFTLYTDFFYP